MEGCRRCEYPRPDLHVWRASGVTKLVRALLNRRPSGRRNACQGARGSSRTGPTGAREGRNGTKRSRGTRTAGSRRGSAARGRRACQAGGSGSACGQGSPCKGPRGCQQWCQGCERNSSDCHGGSWSEGSAKNWYVTILLFFFALEGLQESVSTSTSTSGIPRTRSASAAGSVSSSGGGTRPSSSSASRGSGLPRGVPRRS